ANEEFRILNSRKEIDRLNPLLARIAVANRRRADVTLDLFSKPAEHLRMLQRFVDDAIAIENATNRRATDGSIDPATPPDIELARGHRLDLEIMLLREKQKAKPAK